MDFDPVAFDQPQAQEVSYYAPAKASAGSDDPVEDAALQELLDQIRPQRRIERALSDGLAELRGDAIRDTALSYGTQGGLAWRTKQINEEILKPVSSQLNIVFNFQPLLIDGVALPAVIRRSDDNFELKSRQSARRSTVIFSIENEARLITRPPSWESFLLQDYRAPQVPDQALLPRTPAEADLWRRYVTQGWQEGVEQANEIFQVNLHRLTRVYTGMINYWSLVAQKIISPAQVASGDLGIQRDGKRLSIGDTVYRLTQDASWTDEQGWQPLVGAPQGE